MGVFGKSDKSVKSAPSVKGAILNNMLVLDYFSFFAYTTLIKNYSCDNRPFYEELSMPEAQG